MPIDSKAMDRTGAAAEGRAPPVLSIKLEYMGMVLACPLLGLAAQHVTRLPLFVEELAPLTTTLLTGLIWPWVIEWLPA
mgnify:CR=1 FL=1